ncbi:LPXTG cell wall anchor domain-containing protein [Nocardiopsis sp. HUAS JQ3]|uniref:LPXTG cell wall anchor domain-containing protein n=1 Tax=Nocardiopsis sp. HUAS JQ3 TaxID=3061629 RepID=UPI0023A9E0E4|nr:LPXTG cell wall anchor domain-containing protein [Nocardiopsis sp. HUAS JQ3]WDZ90501.1 LPXTG cell wall anchor domain-containing protein [Nocardiopsis sp. HUAS JQ3]
MKNTRVTARRILQGGAAFAALGALSIATALPAAAQTEYYGWAYASVGNWEGVAVSYDGTTTNSYSGSVGSWLTFSGTSSATVGGDGVTATATVDTARVQLTVSDVEEIVEENLDEESEVEEEPEESEAEESPAPEGEETEPGVDDGQPEDGGDEDTGGDGADGGETGGDENTGGGETGGETDVPEVPETSPAPETDPATVSEPETLVLDEESTELVSGSDEIVLDATLSGVTTTTTQSWGGEVSHSDDVADISYPEVVTLDSGEQITVLIDIQSYEHVEEYSDEENGVTWNDAYTGFAVSFTVDGAEAPFHYVNLAESLASVGVFEQGNGGDDGDDKPAPTHPEDKTEKKPQPEKLENAESLAQTGSPIAGLIAAGAAIAAGGGLAAYFARRRKNTADSAAETSEG